MYCIRRCDGDVTVPGSRVTAGDRGATKRVRASGRNEKRFCRIHSSAGVANLPKERDGLCPSDCSTDGSLRRPV